MGANDVKVKNIGRGSATYTCPAQPGYFKSRTGKMGPVEEGQRNNEQPEMDFRQGRHLVANAMSVDVEDYYHVSAFNRCIPRGRWPDMESRVENNTMRILEMFSEADIAATFFTLGCIAERNPSLVRQIVANGHELASHGYSHERVKELAPADFRNDVRRSKAILEDAAGVPVYGYRAPSYSIDGDNLWAFDILQEEGYTYSSSVYPIQHDHYGMPEAPTVPFCYKPGAIREIPISTTDIFRWRVPCGGGGYFRLYPYRVSRWLLGRINLRDRQPVVFYFHPWEIDPNQPRQRGLDAKTRFRHYLNLERMEHRLRRLLIDFSWDRMDRVFT